MNRLPMAWLPGLIFGLVTVVVSATISEHQSVFVQKASLDYGRAQSIENSLDHIMLLALEVANSELSDLRDKRRTELKERIDNLEARVPEVIPIPDQEQFQSEDPRRNFDYSQAVVDRSKTFLASAHLIAEDTEQSIKFDKEFLQQLRTEHATASDLWEAEQNIKYLALREVREENILNTRIIYALLAIAVIFITFIVVRPLERRWRLQASAVGSQEKKLRGIVENSKDCIMTLNDSGFVEMTNPAVESLFGYEEQEIVGQPISMLVRPSFLSEQNNFVSYCAKIARQSDNEASSIELDMKRKDGTFIPVELGFGEMEIEGKPFYFVSLREISKRRERDEQLQRSEAGLKKALHMAGLGIMEWDLRQDVHYWSPEMCEILELDLSETTPCFESFYPFLPTAIRSQFETVIEAACQGDVSGFLALPSDVHIENLSSGGTKYLRLETEADLDESGRSAVLRIVFQDMTFWREMHASLQERERRFRATFEQSAVGIMHTTFTGECMSANGKMHEILGYEEGELKGVLLKDITHPDDLGNKSTSTAGTLNTNNQTYVEEKRFFKKDKSIIWMRITTSIAYNEAGQLSYLVNIAEDITNRKAMETALQDSQATLEEAQRIGHVGSFVYEFKDDRLTMSKEAVRIFGLDPDRREFTLEEYAVILNENDRRSLHNRIADKEDHYGAGPMEREVTITRPCDGGERVILSNIESQRDESGKLTYLRGVVQDITERKKLEQNLVQSQKMESIGQLTGGIAHDFNNILTVISGNMELVSEFIEEEKLKKRIDLAQRALGRASDLTARLLAFSRRQVLQPERSNINEVMDNMQDMLHRTLREDIEIEINRQADLWMTEVDQSQLENAVLNLAINARDAMPRGGRLIIETENATLDQSALPDVEDFKAGPYVILSITDTGTGIPKKVMERVFEPFFTTKEVGKGSGLGLSMVHGFVKQSGGELLIYSEEGIGTTIKICLPQSVAEEEKVEAEESAPSEDLLMGSETVLLVEDDEDVRETALAILERLGYEILCAEDGKSAQSVFEKEADRIDILITDVVMPGGIYGTDLAVDLKGKKPGLKVICASGYPRHTVDQNLIDDEDVKWLNKPYTNEGLARTIRAVLDQSGAVAA